LKSVQFGPDQWLPEPDHGRTRSLPSGPAANVWFRRGHAPGRAGHWRDAVATADYAES